MKERLNRFISLIETSYEDNTLTDSDIDFLITVLKMLLEEKSKERKAKYDKN